MTAWPPMVAGRVRYAFLARGDELRDKRDLAHAVDARAIAYAEQVHGSHVEIVERESHGALKCDALITAVPGLALAVFCADCQTFAVYCPEKHVLAVLHAGWRGLAQGVITATYEKLKRDFGVDPSLSHVFAGPSLCTACFEFVNARDTLPTHLHPFIEGEHVDLRKAADSELVACGVPLDHVVRHPDCTKCEEHLYWSYRARNYDVSAPSRPGELLHRNALVATLC